MRVVLLAMLLPGCVVDELTAPHAQPGGAVHAQLNGGADRVTTALADGTKTPMPMNGFSQFLTVGFVAGSDSAGGSAPSDLAMPGATLEFDLATSSVTQLELHLDGGGCTAKSGVVHLRVDQGGKLQGDFSASGTTGSAAPCAVTGAIVDVPLAR